MASAMSLFHDLGRSNMPHSAKTTLSRWIGMASGGLATARPAHLESHGMHAMRQYGEAVITGALLGVISAEAKQGLDPKGVPIDGGLALFGLLAKVIGGATSGEHPHGQDLASDAGNIGSVAGGIFTFRKFEQWAPIRPSNSSHATSRTQIAHIMRFVLERK